MTRSLLEEAAKVLRSELTAGQKKLPPALQKAIKDKEDKKDEEMDPKKDMVNKTKKGMEEMMPMNAKKDHKKGMEEMMPKKDMMKKKGMEEMMPKKDMMKKKDEASDFDKMMKKKEELSDKQKKIDMNKNGKIDGEDLAKLRAKKEELEILIAELETKLEE
tara:strand:+ start:573 stop:1055 length:483 start_codon:yes stop_codon:yes gene_type:complete